MYHLDNYFLSKVQKSKKKKESVSPKIQQTKIAVPKISSLFKAEPVYEGRLKVILLLQVRSHDFERTFMIFCLN